MKNALGPSSGSVGRAEMPETRCDHKDPAVNRCLFVAHTFPPIAAVGIYRTLRFMHHLPEFGWEGMVVAMEPDAAIDHPVDHALCSRIPACLLYTSPSPRDS